MLGIYDSGLGGLTALKEARAIMPSEDFIYFGDTVHLPYGTRSPDIIIRYSEAAMRFFEKMKVSAVLCACGTVSSVALDVVSKKFKIPMIGVAEPSVKAACLASKNGKIAVIGTRATITSNIFPEKIKMRLPHATVISKSCDLFVSLVENGFSCHRQICDLAAEFYLSEMADCDTIILGCTHFPLLSESIARVLPFAVQINSGKEGARELSRFSSEKGNGKTKFYLSDTGGSFDETAKKFLGVKRLPLMKQIDIETY